MRLHTFLLWLFAMVASIPLAAQNPGQWPATILDDPGVKERREMLMAHGIDPGTANLIRFLQEGFPDRGGAEFPSRPVLKSTVVNAAIEELGLTAAETAVPVLMEIASQQPPPGVTGIISRDFEQTPIQMVDSEIQKMRRVLSLNAVVALGLIGDERAAETVLTIMRTEVATGFITKGAVALGQMGSNEGLGAVVLLASDVASDDCAAAFATIFTLTGRNYGVTRNTSLSRRREKVAELKEWFESEGSKVAVLRLDVLRRMGTPPREEPLDPGSLRGVLRASRDFSNYDRRWSARRELQTLAPGRIDELESIMLDVNEDLDIRRAAMTWISAAEPKRARKNIRKLQGDENPTVADYARTLERDIEEALKAPEKKS